MSTFLSHFALGERVGARVVRAALASLGLESEDKVELCHLVLSLISTSGIAVISTAIEEVLLSERFCSVFPFLLGETSIEDPQLSRLLVKQWSAARAHNLALECRMLVAFGGPKVLTPELAEEWTSKISLWISKDDARRAAGAPFSAHQECADA